MSQAERIRDEIDPDRTEPVAVFGSPRTWPGQDLIAFSEEFDAQLALAAYLEGVFPMPLHSIDPLPDMGWWSPMDRGVLPLSAVRVSRSLAKSAAHYTTTVDQAFDQVMAGCADPTREGGWIDERIAAVFGQLHRIGVAHSVETWDREGRLVGGLYGVSVGGLFAGESMFHDPDHGRDASKVALLRLAAELSAGVAPDELDQCRVLDVQWVTDHLRTLGAVEISRPTYLQRLDQVLRQPPIDWPLPDRSRRSGRASLPGRQARQDTAHPTTAHDRGGNDA